MPAPTLSPPALTLRQITDALIYTGEQWSTAQLTFSIPSTGATWADYGAGEEQDTGFSPLTATQAADFRIAITVWDDLIAPSIREVVDVGGPGSIRVAFSSYEELAGEAGAYAYGPPPLGSTPLGWEGDIWLSSDLADRSFRAGGFGMLTLIHEIGHALGMKHPFEGSKLPAGYDGTNYTVMSYTDMPGAYQVAFSETATHYVATPTAVAPSTPMVLDVAAIQSVYGADPNTRAGPTTYGFDQDAGFYRTIYDAGGVDTLDLSGLTRGSNIDLAPGAYSSVAYFSVADQITAASRRFPDAAEFIGDVFKDLGDEAYTWSNNLGIALNTTIENVSGGLGADTITGNSAANLINGGAGDDFIRGLDGDDAVDGAAGADDVNGNVGRDIVRGGDGADFVRGGQGDDTVYGDAGDDVHVNGNLGADLVIGGTGADTVYGGQGADTLLGDEGADLLSGDLGDDALVGGPGADRFSFRAGTGFDWIGDFNSAEGDRVVLAPGTAYTLRDVQGQAVIDLGGGSQLGLAGVNMASMGDWLVTA